MLSLLFLFVSLSSCAIQKKKKNTGKNPVEYALTVAAIRPAMGEDPYIEVSFNESARFYRLPRNAAPAYLELLRESAKNNTPVLVKRANEYSDIILRVRKKQR
jgi:hypothetical protein